MTNNVMLTFSVGDTTPWFTISFEHTSELIYEYYSTKFFHGLYPN